MGEKDLACRQAGSRQLSHDVTRKWGLKLGSGEWGMIRFAQRFFVGARFMFNTLLIFPEVMRVCVFLLSMYLSGLCQEEIKEKDPLSRSSI